VTKASGLVLFDTNILVHVLRGSVAGRRAAEDAEQIAGAERPLISVVTLGEVHSLAKQFGWGQKKIDALDELLRNVVVVDINNGPIISRYAELDVWSMGRGRKMGKNDLWIAATTSVTGATLMTLDGDFDHLHPVHLTLAAYNVDGTQR
jgi:predicted nucleic acid-binding protein